MRLNLHTLLRAHEYPFSVDVGGKTDALLGNLAQSRQRKNLKAAAVGQDGTRPVHKLMQSAHVVNQIIARAQVQMVGVGQLDLAVHITLQLNGGYAALYGGAGTDIHKHRGLDIPVYGVQDAAPCATVLGENFKHKHLFPAAARTRQCLDFSMVFRGLAERVAPSVSTAQTDGQASAF